MAHNAAHAALTTLLGSGPSSTTQGHGGNAVTSDYTHDLPLSVIKEVLGTIFIGLEPSNEAAPLLKLLPLVDAGAKELIEFDEIIYDLSMPVFRGSRGTGALLMHRTVKHKTQLLPFSLAIDWPHENTGTPEGRRLLANKFIQITIAFQNHRALLVLSTLNAPFVEPHQMHLMNSQIQGEGARHWYLETIRTMFGAHKGPTSMNEALMRARTTFSRSNAGTAEPNAIVMSRDDESYFTVVKMEGQRTVYDTTETGLSTTYRPIAMVSNLELVFTPGWANDQTARQMGSINPLRSIVEFGSYVELKPIPTKTVWEAGDSHRAIFNDVSGEYSLMDPIEAFDSIGNDAAKLRAINACGVNATVAAVRASLGVSAAPAVPGGPGAVAATNGGNPLVRVIAVKLWQRYTTRSMLLVKGGSELGNTYASAPLVLAAPDPTDMTFRGQIRVVTGALMKRSTFVAPMAHVVCTGILGGQTNQYIEAADLTTLKESNFQRPDAANKMNASVVVLLGNPDVPVNPEFIDVTDPKSYGAVNMDERFRDISSIHAAGVNENSVNTRASAAAYFRRPAVGYAYDVYVDGQSAAGPFECPRSSAIHHGRESGYASRTDVPKSA